ncbi:MAG TPA: AAA family ATPase [Thermoanaerobaculia bacterium]
MYIRRVKIRNVRGFKEVDLDFSRPDGSLAGWTVLAGRNGSGKSTLLKTLGLVSAGPEAARVLNTSFSDWIRGEEQQAEAGVQLEFSDSDKLNHLELLTGWARLQWDRGEDKEPRVSGRLPGTAQEIKGAEKKRYDVVFLNAPIDAQEIEDLVLDLEIFNIRAWIESRDLQPGRKWGKVFPEVLGQTSAMAVVIGKNGPDIYADPAYARGIESFAASGRPVIPVILKSAPAKKRAMPTVLSGLASVDFSRDGDPIQRLIWGITGKDPKSREGSAPILESHSGWFLCGYGPYRRLTGHAVDAERLMAGPEMISRLVSLFREDSSLIECVEWLRDIYLQRLEGKPGAAELEQLVLALLNDGLLPDEVQVTQVDSEGLWVLQHGVRIPLRELSDGYRTTAALVMDIVRHLHRGFGSDLKVGRTNGNQDYSLKILQEGVVLIDEIDLHLHIDWQKRIGFWLKRRFPNIQFIVTTHSPFICQAADPRGLIRLPAPGEDRVTEHVSEDLYNTVVNGSLDDAVLTDLFGLETPYSPEAERLRERVASLEAKLQSGKATDKDKGELRELRSRLPQTLSADVEQALSKLAIEG